jgi:hypothetical protein
MNLALVEREAVSKAVVSLVGARLGKAKSV